MNERKVGTGYNIFSASAGPADWLESIGAGQKRGSERIGKGGRATVSCNISNIS